MLGTPTIAEAQEGGPDQAERSECDRFIEAYLRSSARKVHRALGRGDYNLSPVDLDDVFEVSTKVNEGSQSLEFETFREHDGRVVGVADRSREWVKTYIIAHAQFGPIVISQTWQPRHLRDAGQACEPIYSNVEWPPLPGSTVDIEPFDFWGVRVVWRVPWPESAKSTEQSAEEVLKQLLQENQDGDGESAQ